MNLYLHVVSALFFFVLQATSSYQEKLNLDALNNYSEFLNFGDKKLHKVKSGNLENAIFKSKLDVLGEVFKKNVQFFKASDKLDIVFLVDASSSVGDQNFKSELKFIKKLLSDITVDYNHTRVAVVSFSSPSDTAKNIDDISDPSVDHNKCVLLNEQLMNIEYKGGETYTAGAFQKAKKIFEASNRKDSKKVIFLVTDGYSSGDNPVPISEELKNNQVIIFTIGIRNGNYKELYELSSTPGEFYSYLLDSFEEFESLARRALHVDLSGGDYLPLGFNTPCDKLCKEGDCCDDNALCTCGTTTGHYSCTCQPGFYGSGMRNNCLPCIPGTYSDGPNLCLPCPDVHHTTIPPAQGIESCVCKKGFQSDEQGGCQVLKCPKIKAPDFGYIVKKKECSNVLNSACGVRCEVGYTLVGSSIRICQDNATWSGSDPTCEVKTCNRLPTPKFGSAKCEHTDLGVVYDRSEKNLPVDTVCNFECGKGTFRIGSPQRTCLPIAQWDGLRSICKPVKCDKLPQVKYGKVEPSSCTSGKQEYGKTCTVVCNEGFEASGSVNKTCGDHGLWGKSEVEDTICSDAIPPSLICPKNITTSALSGTNYGHVFWTEPNITDNSGLGVSVWIQPAIENLTDYKFSLGVTPITYFAQDMFNNAIKCKFFVEVLDEEPPTVEGCISPSPFLVVANSQENITWDEPDFLDNSRNITVTKSHEFGVFKLGTTLVTYTATDPSGNVNMCKLNVTVEESQCPDFAVPPNGQAECHDQSNGVKCVITCEEGYAIPLQTSATTTLENSTSFLCNHVDAIWYNQEGLMLPECSVTVLAEKSQDGNVDVSLDTDGACNDTTKIAKIQTTIKDSIVNSICTDGLCEVDIKSECEVEKSEEDTNKLLTRKRRYAMEPTEAIPHKNMRKDRRRKNKLNVKFHIRGKNLNQPGTGVKFQNGTLKLQDFQFSCPNGFIPRKNRCVQCPRGAFHNSTTNICQSCDFGSYNEKVGQSSCVACPPNHSTRKMHVKSSSECRAMCPPGTHARKKKAKASKGSNVSIIERATLSPHCKSCPAGTYQPNFGQIRCIPCPSGFTTIKARSINSTECISMAADICENHPSTCNNGKCLVVNQYQYSCECTPGFFGTFCDKKMSPCDSQPCQNSGSCLITGGGFNCSCPEDFTGKYCESAIEKGPMCAMECYNGGSCLDVSDNEFVCACPTGFYGDHCETKGKICDNVLCENNSTCIEDENSFKCVCTKGFIGRRCNILPCDFKPCEELRICINVAVENATRSDFRCVCPEGYTGPKCLQKIDFCSKISCENGAQCVSDETGYRCSCSKLFYGPHCEFRKKTNYILNFSRYDINDFIRLRGFEGNLTEITACLWLQTMDSFNYGTLLSYATQYTDNAFTLTDYTGLVLYVNKKYVVTDVLLNDGYWHHICASWSSTNGTYHIYVDGEVVKNGSDLAPFSTIGGRGYLIVGQEQDVLGGRFSQSESFVGNMAYVDVWSKILTHYEIMEHQNDCTDSMLGDLYAWPEMQEHTNGNLQMLTSSFCQRCEDPKPLYNGFIDIVDNKAFYSCYVGFQLSSQQFSNGRRCTKTSKWEGFYEPFCKKVSCSYPGAVRNAYSIGNRYFYNDKVTYQCYDGFNMVGNPTIICKESEKWYPAKPRCMGPQCILPTIQNGRVEVILQANEETGYSRKVDMETQIRISCDSNTSPGGEMIATCLEDGTWDNLNISCQPTKKKLPLATNCPINQVPPPPTNGYIDESSRAAADNGSTDFVEYKCRSGYRLKGVNISSCIVDGYWTDHNVTCEVIECPLPPQLENKTMKYKELQVERNTYGTMLKYECLDGYTLSGDGVIRCTSTGTWSKIQAICSRISCGQPFIPPGSKLSENSFLYGDSVTVTCTNQKSFNLTCLKDGSWNLIDYSC
ncbi:sushi, von Willebrand factor type A, EGF and pentraxin domain-containing protein 1-like [Euwallacea fornicatus]|uniref:sushi, von Willebrand factor type A, EGF and pentraxin domain-containing protein 1-like n=1 Tax=Euwallacea fornicatus TaxID=995702 RepID=UPI00338FFD8F